jgi:Fe-S-cluster containining protein
MRSIIESKQNSKLKLSKFLDTMNVKSYSLVKVMDLLLDKTNEETFSKILDEMKQRIFIWKNEISQFKPGSIRAKKSFELFEKEFAQHIIKNISCHKGCHHCCSWKVEITEDEAEVLANIIKSGEIKVDLEKLEKQSQNDNTGRFWQFPSDDTQCVFLDKSKGACGIYESRPIACRKCIVESSPKYCETMDKINLSSIIIPEIELLTSLIWSHSSGDVNTLPSLVWKKLKEKD